MVTCSNCEKELPENSHFCPRCGLPTAGGIGDELLASSASDPTGLLDRIRAATAGEFTIIRELGRGGMGRVYLAHENAIERRVALKVLPPSLADHSEIVQRFEREAQTAGKLSHPNIVPVYQVSERAGISFFTMPYVAGPSLRQVVRQTPQLDFDVARRYLSEAADALSYAHDQGVIHRDIKPENMLLEGSRDGRLLLTDFGIAKALGTATTLTRPGDMMGTPYFMSPEQCEEKEEIDGRSDQYSLGLVAYEILAGRFPFTADSLAGIIYKHLHDYPEPLETIRQDVPENLRLVIETAIRKDPGQRSGLRRL
jgi:serine/threonine-protein kinase